MMWAYSVDCCQINIAHLMLFFVCYFFFIKQKTAYEMRISDWSSDVCSSDLADRHEVGRVEECSDLHLMFERETSRLAHLAGEDCLLFRSEERRVGKACVRTCRSRW